MINMQVIGTQQVIARLNQAKAMGKRGMKPAVMAGGLVISNAAKERAPYLTGQLKRSIHPEAEETSNSIDVLVGSNLDYAKKMEFGGSRKAPDGYLRVSLDEKRDEAIRAVAGAFKKMYG